MRTTGCERCRLSKQFRAPPSIYLERSPARDFPVSCANVARGLRQMKERTGSVPSQPMVARRVRPAPDCQSTRLVRGGQFWGRTGAHRLRSRCHDNRFVSVGVPLGQISHRQSGGEAAYAAGSARLYSQPYSHLRRQTPRSQCARPAAARSGSFLTSWIVGTTISLV